MPVFEPGTWLNPDTRPDWCEIGSIGRFAVPLEGGRFERHHHDDHEVWLIWEGKAKILVDGEERYVQAGDIVLTQAGDIHDIVEVYETVRGFFLESGHPAGGRIGHLDGVAHDVPGLPVPADFPVR
ncbi:AraC family ligand binding domain-containing protein [Schumannella luteola]